MIPASLVTHTATVTRQGTRTSDAGDTVADGIYADTGITAVPCIAEETAGDAPSDPARSRERGTWTVLLPLVDVQPRDRITITELDGPVSVLTVLEVRRFPRPTSVAHLRATCTQVVG